MIFLDLYGALAVQSQVENYRDKVVFLQYS
jgi:hypothetical protein